jgi:Fe-S-cluster-containing dehydrogenase component
MTVSPVPPAFVFDPNTCVGCQACAIACVNENRLTPGRFWRQVVTFNPARRPGLPTWHLSIACNHCLDAPCLRGCPARAIARDDPTGAVLIDDGRCIGCRYCSWVCPYDAPRFDATRGVMGKCTFCSHRLAAGLAPACASLCPTGALRIGAFGPSAPPAMPGLTDVGIRPALQVVARRPRIFDGAANEASPGAVAAVEPGGWADALPAALAESPPAKLSFRSEWTLAAFTFTAIVLVAWVMASRLGGPAVHVVSFLAFGALATVASALHLGRPERAWRAALNWRRSWLSREVIAWGAFLAAAGVALLAAPGDALPAWITAGTGLACLACVDRVYTSIARPSRPRLDDVAAVTSAAFLAGIVARLPAISLPLGVWRLVAFWARSRAPRGPADTAGRAGARVGLGVLALLLPWVARAPLAGPLAVACALAAEAIDRADFYDRLEVVTPGGEMVRAEAAATACSRIGGGRGHDSEPTTQNDRDPGCR